MSQPRALLAALHQAAVQGANPFTRTRDAVRYWLASNDIAATQRVHVFALGKAGATMAAGAHAALNERHVPIVGGVVVVAALPHSDAPAEQGGGLPDALEVRVGDHPVPDIGSLAAADVIARKVRDVREGDITLVLISGGATSLCAAPCDELRDLLGHAVPAHELLMSLVATLHRQGLAIHEMNAIRRRLLRWAAGRLAVALYDQGASEIPVFAVSDVIGDDPSVIGSGPCTPDPMSDAEFLAMLDAYNLRSEIPTQLGEALGLVGDAEQAVRPPSRDHHAFSLVAFDIVARNRDACLAIAAKARESGLTDITVVDEPITGDAEALGHAIATVAVRAAGRSENAQLIVWGGEPTVSFSSSRTDEIDNGGDDENLVDFDPVVVNDVVREMFDRETIARDLASEALGRVSNEEPLGGRMQALALAGSLALEQMMGNEDGTWWGASRVHLLAAGTDGRDGPTDACGAIVDIHTVFRAGEGGRDALRDLRGFRSYYALKAARALVTTGPTGTNVMDVVVAYIVASPPSPDSGGSPPFR